MHLVIDTQVKEDEMRRYEDYVTFSTPSKIKIY